MSVELEFDAKFQLVLFSDEHYRSFVGQNLPVKNSNRQTDRLGSSETNEILEQSILFYTFGIRFAHLRLGGYLSKCHIWEGLTHPIVVITRIILPSLEVTLPAMRFLCGRPEVGSKANKSSWSSLLMRGQIGGGGILMHPGPPLSDSHRSGNCFSWAVGPHIIEGSSEPSGRNSQSIPAAMPLALGRKTRWPTCCALNPSEKSMGIRFFCPQGHKLNVKSFLAGKKGFCPHCNARVDIPLSSTRTSSRGGTVEDTDYEDVAQQIETYEAQQEFDTQPTSGGETQSAASPQATHAGTTPQPGVAVAPGNMGPQQSQVGATPTIPAGPATPASPASPAAPVSSATPTAAATPSTPAVPAQPGAVQDPIAEAPEAVWYVRPRTGGQYGPTAGNMLQQWIEEGRVASDTYVWREGWPTWQQASTVFSKFQVSADEFQITTTGFSGNPIAVEDQTASIASVTVNEETSAEAEVIRRPRGRGTVWLVVLMSAIAVALIPVLIWLAMR